MESPSLSSYSPDLHSSYTQSIESKPSSTSSKLQETEWFPSLSSFSSSVTLQKKRKGKKLGTEILPGEGKKADYISKQSLMKKEEKPTEETYIDTLRMERKEVPTEEEDDTLDTLHMERKEKPTEEDDETYLDSLQTERKEGPAQEESLSGYEKTLRIGRKEEPTEEEDETYLDSLQTERKEGLTEEESLSGYEQTLRVKPLKDESTIEELIERTSSIYIETDKPQFSSSSSSSSLQIHQFTSQTGEFTFYSYQVNLSKKQSPSPETRDLQILQTYLNAEVLSFLEKQGSTYLLEASQTGKRLIETLDNHLYLFTPSGKVYLTIEELGSGAFKTTYKSVLIAAAVLDQLSTEVKFRALSLTKEKQLIKMADDEALKAFENEIEINEFLKQLDLPNVSIPKSIFETAQGIAMTTEVCNGNINGLLEFGIHRISLADHYFIAAEMASGVAQLHSVGIVHRDLKPDNFLFIMNKAGKIVRVKVIDFGVSSHLEEGKRYKSLHFPFAFVDPNWHAPTYENAPQFLPESDIYQLGVTLYALLTEQSQVAVMMQFKAEAIKLRTDAIGEGKTAEENVKQEDKGYVWMKKVKEHPEQWEKMDTIQDNEVKEFLLRMLSLDASKRPTAQQVAEFFYKKRLEAQEAGAK